MSLSAPHEDGEGRGEAHAEEPSGTGTHHPNGAASNQTGANPESRPIPLPVLAHTIPEWLQAISHWVVWRYVWKPPTGKASGKWDKPPANARTGRAASSTDPSTWSTFDEALAAYRAGGFDGIGFVVHKHDELMDTAELRPLKKCECKCDQTDNVVVLDLDKCRDPQTGRSEAWAAEIVAEIDSYAEASPSDRGARIVAKGRKPAGRCRTGAFEVYETARFVTITGHRLLDAPAGVEERQGAIGRVHARMFPTTGKTTNGKARPSNGQSASSSPFKKTRTAGPAPLSDGDIEALLEKAANAPKYRALMAGRLDDHDGDHSRADAALCAVIAFYTDDPAQIERLFNRSRLANRPKWVDRPDYRERTIAFALESRTERYSPAKPFASSLFGSAQRTNGRSSKGKPDEPADENSQSPGGPDKGSGDGDPEEVRKCGYEMILDYFRTYYAPIFRRGTVLYSSTLGREVRMQEAVCGAPAELLMQLMEATDAPRDKKTGLDHDQLPWFFGNWCRSAWVDLLHPLPEEETCPEISDHAQEEFRAKMKAALHTLVSMGERTHGDGSHVTDVERRSLIDWCVRWAKVGRWESIRGHTLWVRREPRSDGGERLAIALRVELFHQIHFRPFASLTQNKYGRLATRYGVGENRTDSKVNGTRATILTPEFIDELLAKPGND